MSFLLTLPLLSLCPCFSVFCCFALQGSSRYLNRSLDNIATLCLSDGTNAYTAEDHTAYEICTAGAEGLRHLNMPAAVMICSRSNITRCTTPAAAASIVRQGGVIPRQQQRFPSTWYMYI